MKKLFSGILLTIIIFCTLTLAFNIQPVKASGTIYIRADGSIDPPDAPISTVDNITYTLTGNIVVDAPERTSAIVVERDNIVVEGGGYTVEGIGTFLSDGMELWYRNNVTLENLMVTNFYEGIHVLSSTNITLVGNNVFSNGDSGIRFYNSFDDIIVGNTVTNNSNGISLESSSSNNLTGNTAYLNNFGILSWGSDNNILSNNNASHNNDGIHLESSSNNALAGNTANSNNQNGIFLWYSDNNVLAGNNALNNEKSGIILTSCNNNNLADNNASSNSEHGISICVSSNNIISGNTVCLNSPDGIYLQTSVSTMILNNTISAGSIGVYLYYYSDLNTIRGNIVTGNSDGICLYYYSDDNAIFDNTVSHCDLGFRLEYSNNNTIDNNAVTSNRFVGIYLAAYSYDNRIKQNVVADNNRGMNQIYSENNTIYGNSFINNTELPEANTYSANIWDDGYPSGGNYWSDYTGVDADGDGIGDTPYVIDSTNQDNYPLMAPWTPPDLAVLNITASKTVIGKGYPLSIIATSTNQGNKIEAFSLRVYANTTLIGSLDTMLVNGPSIALWVSWDTSDCSRAYVISANVTPVEGETDLSDNTLVYGIIVVSCGGDVNLDYVTDGKDFVLVKKAIGSTFGSSRWNSGADLNGDTVVDVQDYQIVKTHIPSQMP